MTIRFIGTNYDGVDADVDGDMWFLADERVLSTRSGEGNAFDFLSTSGGQIVVAGHVSSHEAVGIASDVVSHGNTVYVGATGVVKGFSNAIELNGDSYRVNNLGEVHGGIKLIGYYGQMLNGGDIRRTEVGVAIEGNSNTFVNDGYMETDLSGLSVAGTDNGVDQPRPDRRR